MPQIIKWPFGPATVVALTATGAQDLTIVNDLTIIDGVTIPATGDRTLNITVGTGVSIGARLALRLKTAATESTIFGTAIDGASVVGVAGKTKTVEAVYNGATFDVIGTAGQID